jgi:small subunit ribosomal protein S4
MKLFLKGDRCYMAKCPIDTGRAAPGMHGARRSKPSDYCRQLREKQRLKRHFGMRDGQFKVFFRRALQRRGITADYLLQMLEMRLDNLAYRLGFAPSRRAARQLVLHRHLLVNGHNANIPSMLLKAGDRLEVKERKVSREAARRWLEAAESKPLAPWLGLDRKNFRGEVLHLPTRAEMTPLVNEQLVVELCSK